MKKALIVASVFTLALAGCATKPNTTTGNSATTSPSTHQNTTHRPYTQQFLCNNGMSPVIHVPSDSQIILELENTRTTLNIAKSGSGSLYTTSSGIFGYGGTWHQVGNEALFEYKNLHGVPAKIQCSVE